MSTVMPRKRTAWPALLHRMVRTVRTRRLFEPGDHLLVALSGGPDSVALMSLLHRLASAWRLSLTAAHFNYGLRGAESDGDQRFVEDLCRRLHVPLIVRRVDARRAPKESRQAAARRLRYEALADIAGTCGAQRIALGHTADDQAETVLLWMLRGAGMAGLAGMPAARDGSIIRPLYDCTRQEILTYLDRTGQGYRTDSSNDTLVYMRNRIRHEVLPLLKRLAPSAVRALCRSADLCRDDDASMEAHVAAIMSQHLRLEPNGTWAMDRDAIRPLPGALQRRVVRDLLRRCDRLHRAPSLRQVDMVLQALASNRNGDLVLSETRRLLLSPDLVQWSPSGSQQMARLGQATQAPLALDIPSTVRWPATGQTIRVEACSRNEVRDLGDGRARIVIDAERLSGPLLIRSWRPGDRFHPAGMGGRSKKLQDFFTDCKVPPAVRTTIPVVTAPEGVVWIAGYRQDGRWAVTETTKRCAVLTIEMGARGVRAEGAS